MPIIVYRLFRIGPFHPIKTLFPFKSNVTMGYIHGNILRRLLNILKRLNQAFTRTTAHRAMYNNYGIQYYMPYNII